MKDGFTKLINERIDYLKRISLFNNINNDNLYLLACHLTETKYK